MDKTSFEKTIPLFYINFLDCKDSYCLVKTLSRRFDIINFSHIADELIDQKLVERTLLKGIYYYELTVLGDKYLSDKTQELVDFLRNNYSKNNEEYIGLIISKCTSLIR